MIQDKRCIVLASTQAPGFNPSEFGSIVGSDFHGKINIDLDTCYDLGCDRSSSEIEFAISNAVRRSVCSTKGTAAFKETMTVEKLESKVTAYKNMVDDRTSPYRNRTKIEISRTNFRNT